MDHSERLAKIESYGNAYDVLAEALKQFPKEMWQYKPTPERWSIQETVIHITDSEANSFIRCRRFIAEPGKEILGYDESGWAVALNYAERDADEAVELFKWLRQSSYNLIRTQPESVWANTVNHTENGLMTMDDWLDVYDRHVPDHLQQMQEVYKDWVAEINREV